jgi:hypothetical protein
LPSLRTIISIVVKATPDSSAFNSNASRATAAERFRTFGLLAR